MTTEQIHAQREVIVAFKNELGVLDSYPFKAGMNTIDSSLWELLRKRTDSRGKSTIDQMVESKVLTPLNEAYAAAVREGRFVVPTGPVMPVQVVAQSLAETGSEEAAIAALTAAGAAAAGEHPGIKEPPAATIKRPRDYKKE